MSPNAMVSVDTSEERAALNPNHANMEPNTSSLDPSSSQEMGVQEPESSNSSGPPPSDRDTPLENPFREGDAPVGYFYPNSNSMQKSLKPAAATHMDPAPATLPPVLTANADPFADADPSAAEMTLDESLLPHPSLPARPSGLSRGLQIPSRISLITWGFGFPQILAEQGVTKSQWKLFMRELKAFAELSVGQWVTVVACTHGVSLLFGAIVGQSPGKNRFRSMLLTSSQVTLLVIK